MGTANRPVLRIAEYWATRPCAQLDLGGWKGGGLTNVTGVGLETMDMSPSNIVSGCQKGSDRALQQGEHPEQPDDAAFFSDIFIGQFTPSAICPATATTGSGEIAAPIESTAAVCMTTPLPPDTTNPMDRLIAVCAYRNAPASTQPSIRPAVVCLLERMLPANQVFQAYDTARGFSRQAVWAIGYHIRPEELAGKSSPDSAHY